MAHVVSLRAIKAHLGQHLVPGNAQELWAGQGGASEHRVTHSAFLQPHPGNWAREPRSPEVPALPSQAASPFQCHIPRQVTKIIDPQCDFSPFLSHGVFSQ